MRKHYVILLICVLILSTKAQNTFEFLRLDMSPRAAALAGSYVANGDDPNVIFYNPAGIQMLEDQPASFSFVKHLVDINSASVAYSREISDIGRFGAAVQYISYGSFTEADEFGNELGEFGASEFAFILGYANKLDNNFYYGVNVKFIYSGIADYSATGLAADLGLHYEIPESEWNFGFSILNLGSQLSSYFNQKEELPLDIRFGLSKAIAHTPFKIYASLNKLNEDQDNFGNRFSNLTVGTEIRFSESFKIRIGYDNEKRKEMKLASTAGLAGYNIGFGFNVGNYIVDYGFSSLGSIGGLHRFGISTTF